MAKEIGSSVSEIGLNGSDGNSAGKHPSDVERLLQELSDGNCKGVKGATVYKIIKYARERGFI